MIFLPDLQVQDHAVVAGLHAGVLLVVADEDALVAQVVAEGVDDFVVEEREQPVAGVDQVHLDVEAGEDRRVLAADDAGAVDGDGARGVAQVQDRVAVKMRGWLKSMSGGRYGREPVAMTK